MLENYTETTNSDNRFRCLGIDKDDEIIIGGTCTHIFILPFLYSQYVTDSKIIYKQGLNVVLEKDPQSYILEEDTEKNVTTLTLKLSPAETALFKRNLLDAFVQMRIINTDGEVLYNRLNRLIVREPLDVTDSLHMG